MPNPVSSSKNPIVAFFALIIIGPFKLRTLAYGRVFSGLSFPYEAIALAFSIIAARSGNHGFNVWAFLLLEWLGFPLLWLVSAKQLLTAMEKSAPKVTKAAETCLGKPLKSIAETIAAAPGTAWLWKKAGNGSWVFGLMTVVVVISAVLSSLYTGWLVKSFVEPHAWNFVSAFTQNGIVHTVVTFLSYAVGLMVAGFVGNVLVSAALAGEDKGNGLITSIVVAWVASHYIPVWMVPLGAPTLTDAAVILVAPLNFLLLYPLVVCIASNGLFKIIYNALKPVLDDFFWMPQAKEDKVTTAFRDLFQQSINIALTGYLGWQCWTILTGFNLGVLVVGAGTLFFGAFVYCLGGVTFNNRWGNGVCNALISATVGFETFVHTEFLNSTLGEYAAIVVGVIAAVLNFALVTPLLYAGVCKMLSLPVLNLITVLGTGLRIAHNKINQATFDRVYRASLIIYHECYKTETPSEISYERVVLHLTNIVLAASLGVLTYLGLTAVITTWLLVAVPLSLAVIVLAYSLLGPVVMKGKAPFSGALAGLYAAGGAAAYLTPNHVFDLQYSLLVAGVLGMLVFVFVYPLFYAGVRVFGGELLSGLEKPLDNRLDSATKHVAEPLFAGWHMVAAAWTSLTSIFNGFGRKSK